MKYQVEMTSPKYIFLIQMSVQFEILPLILGLAAHGQRDKERLR